MGCEYKKWGSSRGGGSAGEECFLGKPDGLSLDPQIPPAPPPRRRKTSTEVFSICRDGNESPEAQVGQSE